MEVGKGKVSVIMQHRGEVVFLESEVRFCGTASAGGKCTAFALGTGSVETEFPAVGEEVQLSLVWGCGTGAEVDGKITAVKDGLIYLEVGECRQENPNQHIIDDLLEAVGDEAEAPVEAAVLDCTPCPVEAYEVVSEEIQEDWSTFLDEEECDEE